MSVRRGKAQHYIYRRGGFASLAVSRKREYFKYWPETIGYSEPEVAKFGARRPATNSQKPAIGRHFLDCCG